MCVLVDFVGKAFLPDIMHLFVNQGNLNPMSSASVLGSSLVYNSRNQGESGSSGQVLLLSTTTSNLPERPDQPECRYYMNTGTCKYGSDCKYHHPKERIAQLATSSVGSPGLPSRPVSFTFILCSMMCPVSDISFEIYLNINDERIANGNCQSASLGIGLCMTC